VSSHGISVQSLLDGPDGELNAIAQAEPVKDARDVEGNDVLADLHPRRDLAVRQALTYEDDYGDIFIR
jgi:hypothetical protein